MCEGPLSYFFERDHHLLEPQDEGVVRSHLKKLLEALLSRYADIPCLQILGDSDAKGVLAVFDLGFDYF